MLSILHVRLQVECHPSNSTIVKSSSPRIIEERGRDVCA